MKVISSVAELSRAVNAPIAFVPTLGALHAGHQSLITKARKISENVLVSVYVNPLQFESDEDLERYPRSPEVDEELAAAAGATILWRPSQNDLYPNGVAKISAGAIGGIYEGKRAGHFDGVLTVVNALFLKVEPTWAIFGEKDLQQLFLIRKMTNELHPTINIISSETIRDNSGLALSSRNARLSESEKQKAAIIFKSLIAARSAKNLTDMKREMLAALASQPEITLDYAEIIDGETFENAVADTQNKRAIIAGWINGIRLIDNMPMQENQAESKLAAL